MNSEDFEQELNRFGINQAALSLNGSRDQGSFEIDPLPIEKWRISFVQNERKVGLCNCDTEVEAWRVLLEHLKHLSILRTEQGPMTVFTLKSALDREGIDPIRYSLDGQDFPGDWFVLNKEPNGKWSVCYTERGGRDGLFLFDGEAPACEYFLTLMVFNKRRGPSAFLLKNAMIQPT
jgi:hypothetical protein